MCDHERLRTVGDRVFCCNCGEELTIDFLLSKNKPAEPKKTTTRKKKSAE